MFNACTFKASTALGSAVRVPEGALKSLGLIQHAYQEKSQLEVFGKEEVTGQNFHRATFATCHPPVAGC